MVTSEGQVHRFTFESYGFRVSLESDQAELLRQMFGVAEKALLRKLLIIENPGTEIGHVFRINFRDGLFYLFENGVRTNYSDSEFILFKYFNSILRVTIAENAVNTVFVHAGVVGWNGKAVIFPGRSYSGKTTLVAELMGLGAEYYSDEYAVIGADGLVRPFPRDLSIRSYFIKHDVVDVAPAMFGSRIGRKPHRIGSVIITEFSEDEVWQPKTLTIGEGILETIPHTIPIKADTAMSLKILNLAFENAIMAKSFRGDAKRDAVAILAFLDKHLN